jgi:alanyl-tRNA synthetase
VLRMILRRAVRYGRKLGLEDPFLYRMVPVVASLMSGAYPGLKQHREHVGRVILSEEERFHNTLTFGLEMLSEFIKETKERGDELIPAEDVFKLYDTYGFPVDLTELVAREEGLRVDSAGFEKRMAQQKEKTKATWKKARAPQVEKAYRVVMEKAGASEFYGHRTTEIETMVKAVLKKGTTVSRLDEGDTGEVILEKTPFYAEAGGQVGDAGRIYNREMTAIISDTQAPLPGLITHKVKVVKGTLSTGDAVTAEVDVEKRMGTARHHTATHLLHNALRRVLGDHVKQAGSLVAPDRLRFDFTHFTAMSPQEINRVEELVNEKIRENDSVKTFEMDFDEAQKKDIIAIFGEKYGERVRVVDIGGYSKELCGGTHVSSAGQIGLFKILSESSVAAGVRRIEAVSGASALRLFQKRERQVSEIAQIFKSDPETIVERVEALKKEQKRLKKAAARVNEQELLGDLAALVRKAPKVKGITLVTADLSELPAEGLRSAGDRIKKQLKSGVVVLGSRSKGGVQLICMITEDIVTRGLHAGKVVRGIAKVVGGSGGGQPHMAQAGGSKPEKLDEALKKAKEVVKELLLDVS